MSINPIIAHRLSEKHKAEKTHKQKGKRNKVSVNQPTPSANSRNNTKNDLFDSIKALRHIHPDILSVLEIIIAENPELEPVLALLTEEMFETINQELVSLQKQAENYPPLMKGYFESRQLLTSKGIVFEKGETFAYPEIINGQLIEKKVSVESNILWGIKLSPEILLSDQNPYQKRLEDYKKDNPDLEELKKETEEEIAELEKHPLLLKFSKKKRDDLRQAQALLKLINEKLKIQKQYEKQSLFYGNLSIEDKKLIIDHFVQRDIFIDVATEYQTLSHNINLLQNKKLLKRDYYTVIEYREYFLKILKNLLKNSKISKKYSNLFKKIKDYIDMVLNMDENEFEKLIEKSQNTEHINADEKTNQILYFICNEICEYGKQKIIEMQNTNQLSYDDDEGDEND